MAISLFLVVVRCYTHLLTLSAISPLSKTPGLPLELELQWYLTYCRRWDVSTSGLGHIGWPHCYFRLSVNVAFICRYLSVAWSKTLFTAHRNTVKTSDVFGCMSLWLWLCALDDGLLLLPVLSVILKMYKYRSLYSGLVILPFSVSNIQKYHICEVYIFASQAYNAGIVAKPVTWTTGR